MVMLSTHIPLPEDKTLKYNNVSEDNWAGDMGLVLTSIPFSFFCTILKYIFLFLFATYKNL